MSIDVNVTNDLVVVTESSEDITVNVSNAPGPAGQGVPVGGTAGQVLKKLSNTNYDTFWTLDGVGVPYTGATGDVNLGAFNLTATSIIKSGGTSSQFLKADGSVDSTTYQPLLTNPVTGTGATGQVAYWNGTNSQTGSNNLFWDAANSRLGVFNSSPLYNLEVGSVSKTTNSIVNTATDNPRRAGFSVDNGSENRFFAGYVGSTTFNEANSEVYIGSPAGYKLAFGTSNTIKAKIFNTGNLVLQNGGTFSDAGQRLQVQGDAFIKGSGATSGTIGLQVQDSGGANMLRLLNDTTLKIGSQNVDIFPTANGSSVSNAGRGLIISTGAGSQGTGALKVVGTSLDASGNNWSLWLSHTFGASSGTATHSGLLLNQTINQTGGANGITRGLYVNPTLTAAADWRSIEWSNNSGWGLYGAGTANNYLGGRLSIATTNTPRRLNIEQANGSTAASIGLYSSGTLVSVIGIDTASTTDLQIATAQSIRFYASSTIGNIVTEPTNEKMRLTAAGRLLLGTTTESTFILDVNGTARVSGDLFGSSYFLNRTNSGGYYSGTSDNFGFWYTGSVGNISLANAQPIVFSTANTERLRITSGGNLLVGTTTDAGQKLQVVGTTISTATNIPFQSVVTSSEMYNSFFVNTSTLIGYIGNGDGIITNGGTNNFGIRAEADLIFAAGGNNRRMTITSGGNLLVGTTTDIASSKVTISSTTQGFLPPRMTTTQKNAIGTPAAGLIVYDTDTNKLCCYNGSTWNDLF